MELRGSGDILKEILLKHYRVAKRNLIYYVKELESRLNDRHLSEERLIDKVIKIVLNSNS
jgi:hypothetical protein